MSSDQSPTPIYDQLRREWTARKIREYSKAMQAAFRRIAATRIEWGVKPGESLDAAMRAGRHQ